MHTPNLASLIEVLEALEGTETAAWAWDLDSDVVRWSANSGPLFGLSRGYQLPTSRAIYDLIHPEDRERVETEVSAAIADRRRFEIDYRTVREDGTVHWLMSRAQVIADENATARRVVGVTSDVTARKRRAEQERFLAVAADLLSRSLDVDETLKEVARLLVTHLADWCIVQLLDADGTRLPTVAHRDPESLALAERLLVEYPPDPRPGGVAAAVIESGEAILLSDITDDVLAADSRDERHLGILRSLGLRSAIVAPIRARDHVLGVMTLVCAESGYRYGPEDLAFVEDFGKRAGLAVENAALLEEADSARLEAERNAQRLQLLQKVITELSAATAIDDVAEAAIRRGIASTGADRGSLVLFTDTGPSIVSSWGYPPERLEALRPMILQPGPLTDAMASGTGVYCESVDVLIERYPNLAEVMRPVTEAAFVALPLFGANSVLGAIGFVYDRSQDFPLGIRQFFEAYSQHVGVAIERSRLFERVHTVADTLQAALAPPPVDSCEYVEADGFYRAGGVGDVGGDWYDVVPTSRGTHMYVIGDVVGRGLEAVAAMAQLRHSTRLLVFEGRTPCQITSALGALAAGDDSALGSTVLLAEYDTESNTVAIASAGHLPPLVVSDSGVTRLQPPLGPPLGVGPQPEREHLVSIEPHECLVMYTDGVIERRTEDIETSLSRLCRSLAAIGPDVKAITSKLMTLAEEAQDDATVVVLSPRPGPADGRRSRTKPADVHSIRHPNDR